MANVCRIQLTTEAETIKPQSEDEPNDVVFESLYGLRTVLLNRPKKLNSLNSSMIRKIVPRLVEWEKSNMANVVVMKGAGEKALCAGGDVAVLAKHNQESEEGWKESAAYFALEYKLDHYIATYKKPYIAFMDGITMGGGVGLSIHAPFRIATERTVFAMPETTIGFFPDVGASFFLSRMDGAVGTYLALTSERLTGPNVFYTGIATHYLHSTNLPHLEARLAEVRFRDTDNHQDRLKVINQTIDEFCTGLPYDVPIQISGSLRQAIDRCFSKNSITDIIAALKEETGEHAEWAQKQIDTMQKRSPTSIHVTLSQMRQGRRWDIAESFKKEHQIATKFMQGPDFTEGVTALLVRKETPRWKPASLDVISSSEDVTGPFFKFDQENELKLFSEETYDQYPAAELGVPKEAEIKQLLEGKPSSRQKLANAVVESRQRRQGMAQIVDEMLNRKTEVSKDGKAKWIDDAQSPGSRL